MSRIVQLPAGSADASRWPVLVVAVAVAVLALVAGGAVVIRRRRRAALGGWTTPGAKLPSPAPVVPEEPVAGGLPSQRRDAGSRADSRIGRFQGVDARAADVAAAAARAEYARLGDGGPSEDAPWWADRAVTVLPGRPLPETVHGSSDDEDPFDDDEVIEIHHDDGDDVGVDGPDHPGEPARDGEPIDPAETDTPDDAVPEISGSGASGTGASGPGASGPGASGPGASGPGASGPDVSGPDEASDSGVIDGSADHGTSRTRIVRDRLRPAWLSSPAPLPAPVPGAGAPTDPVTGRAANPAGPAAAADPAATSRPFGVADPASPAFVPVLLPVPVGRVPGRPSPTAVPVSPPQQSAQLPGHAPAQSSGQSSSAGKAATKATGTKATGTKAAPAKAAPARAAAAKAAPARAASTKAAKAAPARAASAKAAKAAPAKAAPARAASAKAAKAAAAGGEPTPAATKATKPAARKRPAAAQTTADPEGSRTSVAPPEVATQDAREGASQQQRQMLAELGRRLGQITGRGELAKLATREAVELVSADTAAVVVQSIRGARLLGASPDSAVDAEVWGVRTLAALLARSEPVRVVLDGDPLAGGGPTSLLTAPIPAGGRPVGVLICRRRSPRAFSAADEDALARLARICGERLHRTPERVLVAAASVDRATGLGGQDLLRHDLAVALDAKPQHDMPVTLVVAEVVGLARLRTRAGMAAADAALAAVATQVGGELRVGDLLYRMSADELAILLPATTVDGGGAVVQRLTNLELPLADASLPESAAGTPAPPSPPRGAGAALTPLSLRSVAVPVEGEVESVLLKVARSLKALHVAERWATAAVVQRSIN